MGRKKRTLVGYSEPFIADVAFSTVSSGTDRYHIHSMGRRDENSLMFVGCVVSKAIFKEVDIPAI